METDGEKLKDYVKENQKYWDWPPDVFHQVTFLGFEFNNFKGKGQNNKAILYYFLRNDGSKKPIHVRSTPFANLMSSYKAGEKLEIMRKRNGRNNYTYEVKNGA